MRQQKTKKARNKAMKEETGICRFCGQHRIVDVPDSFTEYEVNEEATLNCNCNDSKAYKERKEKEEQIEMAKTSAKGTTFELFHEEFPEIEEILNYSMDALTQKKFKKLTITTGGRTKASITFSKDTIKVEREDKSTYTRETEV